MGIKMKKTIGELIEKEVGNLYGISISGLERMIEIPQDENMGHYPNVIKEAAEKYEPSVLARYVYTLAVQFNKFYQECRILTAEEG